MLAASPTPERSSRAIVTELLSERRPERAAELLRELLEAYERERGQDEDET